MAKNHDPDTATRSNTQVIILEILRTEIPVRMSYMYCMKFARKTLHYRSTKINCSKLQLVFMSSNTRLSKMESLFNVNQEGY